MIELSKSELIGTNLRSSRGNQLKWLSDGYWYKTDNNGYEGLSEYVVSQLLLKSSLKDEEFITYDIETIKYNDHIYRGCRSRNFLKEGERIITLQRLYDAFYGKDLADVLEDTANIRKRADVLIKTVTDLTGIQDFGTYLYKLLVIDALFLNEDRHFHNIGFIEKNGNYSLCPIFDNGASLMSDTRLDYPYEEDVIRMIPRVRSKTISDNFDEQLEALEPDYSTDIQFDFTDQDIIDLSNNVFEYDDKTKERVKRLLIHQRQKYSYYF